VFWADDVVKTVAFGSGSLRAYPVFTHNHNL
jgi:hypothetical protein